MTFSLSRLIVLSLLAVVLVSGCAKSRNLANAKAPAQATDLEGVWKQTPVTAAATTSGDTYFIFNKGNLSVVDIIPAENSPTKKPLVQAEVFDHALKGKQVLVGKRKCIGQQSRAQAAFAEGSAVDMSVKGNVLTLHLSSGGQPVDLTFNRIAKGSSEEVAVKSQKTTCTDFYSH